LRVLGESTQAYALVRGQSLFLGGTMSCALLARRLEVASSECRTQDQAYPRTGNEADRNDSKIK
jgi:hypothetical protein